MFFRKIKSQVDNFHFSFSSWHKVQADNAGGNQDCAINNYASQRGYWDDVSCFGSTVPVLCEASGK